MEEAGYLVLHVHETSNWVAMSKIIPDLVYQYWTEDVRAISCIFDPKCIAQSEYTVPEDDPYHSVELSDVERGVIPHARLMPMSFWGNFPLAWGNGRGSAYGFTGDGYWTYNPLGTQWTLT